MLSHERRGHRLFDTPDHLEDRLSRGRYLLGDCATESDWPLFCTLIRSDTACCVHCRCSVKRIVDCVSLWGDLRDLYEKEGIAETVNMEHVKRHCYLTHPDINPTRLVPIGPELDLANPHGRA